VGQFTVDTKRNLLWLYGGVCAEQNRQDTYYLALNANPLNDTWTKVPANTTPLANNDAAMVYDPDDDVVFAWGYDNAFGSHDHWVYCRTAENPTPGVPTQVQAAAGCVVPDDWNEVLPAVGIQPPGWSFPALAYDTVTKKVIQFGGGTISQYYNQTWAYDIPTQTWTRKALNTTPPPVYSGAGPGLPGMAYNTRTHKILFHQTGNTGAPADWQYDPVADTWERLSSSGSGPATPADVPLAYDAKNDLLVSFGRSINGAEIWQGRFASTALAPPTVPANLSAIVESSTQINLSWTASTGVVAVAGYNLFRNGVQVGTSTIASYQDSNLTPSTSYTYAVSAYDASGNQSAPCATIQATTFSAGGGASLVSRVQFKSDSGVPATSVNVTLPIATTSGNQLIVAVSDYYASSVDGQAFSITDSYNNIWRKAIDYQPGGRIIVYYAENIVGGPNHRITVGAIAPGAYYLVTAVEYSGLAKTNSMDVVASNRDTSAAYTSTSATTAQTTELLFGVHHVWNTTTKFTPTAPWSLIDLRSDGMYQEHMAQDRIVTSTGSYASTGTASTNSDILSVMVSFRAAQ
jgi:hypothetical protein